MARVRTVTRTVEYKVPDVETRVNRGVALLDKKVPGWWEKINLKELDLADSSNCVVGQLALNSMLNGPLDGYYEGLPKLFTEKQIEKREDARHGFNLYEGEGSDLRAWMDTQPEHHPWADLNRHELENAVFSLLTEVWIHVIRARQKAAKKAPK